MQIARIGTVAGRIGRPAFLLYDLSQLAHRRVGFQNLVRLTLTRKTNHRVYTDDSPFQGGFFCVIFAAPKRIVLKSNIRLLGVLLIDRWLRHPRSQRTFGPVLKSRFGGLNLR